MVKLLLTKYLYNMFQLSENKHTKIDNNIPSNILDFNCLTRPYFHDLIRRSILNSERKRQRI